MKRFADFQGSALTGGAPFFNQDFFDLQEEVFSYLNAITQAFADRSGGSEFIISGGAITPNGGNWDIAEALVFLGGEIYRLPAQTAVVAGTKYIKAATDSVTQRVFNDSSTKDFFIEKPLAITEKHGKTIKEILKHKKIVIGYSLIFHPIINKVKKNIRTKKIG